MPSGGPTASSSSIDGAFTRLHIVPLDADLLRVILPASLLPTARNISLHTVETLPEKRFGFVDLPTMEAEKLRKKLNGATVKGAKVKIEKAKPESIPAPVAEEEEPKKLRKKGKMGKKSQDENGAEEDAAELNVAESSKKRKREYDVTEGVELRDRKVKRGWTVSEDTLRKEKKEKKERKSKDKKDKTEKHKKKEAKSKYSDKEELLFRTTLPPTAVAEAADDETDRKRRKKKDNKTVVHEFEKTTKFPTFIKDTPSKQAVATEFVAGKGWVDAEGNVVEAIRSTRSTRSTAAKASAKKEVVIKEPEPAAKDDDTTSSEESTSSDEESDEESNEETTEAPRAKTALQTAKKMTLTPLSALHLAKADSSRPKSSGSAKSLTIKIPPITPAADKVHPLEALYKKPKLPADGQTPAQSQSKPFNFFGAEDDESGQPAVRDVVPLTPFSREDFEFRNIRSAAPTPDTAHPSRRQIFWAPNSQDNDDEEDREDAGPEAIQEEDEEDEKQQEDVTAVDGGATEDGDEQADEETKPEQSDFQKYFWANRGDLNRSWKARRKTAAKDKRRRETRTKSTR